MRFIKLLFLFVFIFSTQIIAQIPGKIVGQVTEMNGEALIGVNIQVKGETLGASTDIDGYYVILNILPGTYTVTATYVGYQSMTVQKVVIRPDLTTEVNFRLSEQVIEMDETIVVTAEQPVIQRDATVKITTLNTEEIQALPISSMQEILSTQSNVSVLSGTPNAKPGYNINGIDDIRMRGGRNNEVALLIDGVKVSNPIFGGFGTQIGKNVIEQIAIESGGFSAKYGNALSGVVNLTTREGRDKTSGSIQYYTSQLFGIKGIGNDHSDALHSQNIQASLSGRLPFFKKLSYFISTEINTQAGSTLFFDDIIWDDYRVIGLDTNGDGMNDSNLTLPSSKEIVDGYLRYNSLDSIQRGLATNWKKVVGPDGRMINPLDNIKGWNGLGWNNFYNIFGKLGFQIGKSIRGRLSFLTDKRFRQTNNFDAYYDYNMQGQNIQILTSNKQTISINHALSPTSFYDLRLSRFFESRRIRILKDYSNKYAAWYNPFDSDKDNLKKPEEYVPYLSAQSIQDPFENAFYLKADNRWYSGDSSANWEIRFDYTNQILPEHIIETGFQYNYIDIYYHSFQNITNIDDFPTIYHRTPQEGALYLQMKSEFDKLIINAGLRLDYLYSGGDFWSDPFDPLGEQDNNADILEYNSIKKVKAKWNLSPRIGLAYPLTTITVLSFNFGHFYQNANYRDMYRASGSNREISLMRGNLIGNPNLTPEKSVQYELSLQQQFGNDYGVKINLWSKETTNQVGSVMVPAYSDAGRDNPFSYAVFVNNNFGSARGLDVEIKKSISGSFGFTINYTWSQAKVLQATSWDGYWAGNDQDDLPKHETTAPWDQPYVVRANFQYMIGEKKGISTANIFWFQNMIWSLIYYGESGMPYTPTISGGVITEPYSQRWPASHRFDIRIAKKWNVFGQQLRAFLEIKNLLDNKNVLSGYTLTGSATNPGTSSYYTRSSSYWDSRNNNNFALRRIFYLGLEILI
jgi:outer membrane receptor protein involved in Fe transport